MGPLLPTTTHAGMACLSSGDEERGPNRTQKSTSADPLCQRLVSLAAVAMCAMTHFSFELTPEPIALRIR
jgi:hypothetical protein